MWWMRQLIGACRRCETSRRSLSEDSLQGALLLKCGGRIQPNNLGLGVTSLKISLTAES